MKKRGQITIFIIIGILLLFATALTVYIRNQIRENNIEIVREPILEEIPKEAEPIREFVTSCITQTATNALLLMGEQGGYTTTQHLSQNPQMPTESQTISMSLPTPYWWHLRSPNNCMGINACKFESLRPALFRINDPKKSMESQLDNYVAQKLRDCTNKFREFTSMGFSIDEQTPQVITTVTNDDILFVVTYPLTIKKNSRVVSLTKYYTRIPLRLKEIYNLATRITNAQSNYSFLESNTMELINIFSAPDKDKLPPIAESEFRVSPLFWLKSDVRKRVEEMLQNYVPFLQVQDSLNYNRIVVEQEGKYENVVQRIYDNMILPLEGAQGKRVDFSYFDIWPIYLDINAGAELVMAESIYSGPLQFGLSRYSTAYHISYPVLVDVYDPQALNFKGYSFKFALESNIRNNEPLNVSYTPLQAAEVVDQSLLCDPRNRKSGTITIRVNEAGTKKPAADVQILFSAGEDCFIGVTDSKGILEAKFPIAAGEVTLLSERHLGKKIALTTSKNPKEIAIDLVSKREKKVMVQKKVIRKLYNFETDESYWGPLDPTPTDLFRDEEAVIIMERKGEQGDEPFTTLVHSLGKKIQNITLVPGTYQVSGVLISHKPITIEPQKRSVDAALGLIEKEYYVPEEPLEIEDYPSGGVEFGEDEAASLTAEEMDFYKTLVLYVGSYDLEGAPELIIEDIEVASEKEELSKNNRGALKPKWTMQ